jgi:hypothetical protein
LRGTKVSSILFLCVASGLMVKSVKFRQKYILGCCGLWEHCTCCHVPRRSSVVDEREVVFVIRREISTNLRTRHGNFWPVNVLNR